MVNDQLRNQIYNNMNLKETEELLEIWQTNDRVEWTDTTFEVVKEILTKRGMEAPDQDKPIYEYDEEKDNKEDASFTELELKIIDDENPPVFFDPFDVLKISKWIEIAATASIIIVIALGLTELPRTRSIVWSYFPNDPRLAIIATLIALGIWCITVALQVTVTYFPLRALAQILKVLVEMEFNSRKVK